jgi:integrase
LERDQGGVVAGFGSAWPEEHPKGSGRWRVVWRLRGETKKHKVGTFDKAEADLLVKQIRLWLEQGRDPAVEMGRVTGVPTADPGPEPGMPTLGDWLTEFPVPYRRDRQPTEQRFNTVQGYIDAQFDHPPLNRAPMSTDPRMGLDRYVGEWLDRVRRPDANDGEPYADSTIESWYRVLNLIVNVAVDEGWLDHNPLKRRSGTSHKHRIKKPTKRRVWLTLRQFRHLLAETPTHHRALLVVLVLGGLRWEEAIALRWRDLNLELPLPFDDKVVSGPGRIHVTRAVVEPKRNTHQVVKETKTHTVRTVALGDIEHAWLLWHRERFGGGPNDRVFWSPGNGTKHCEGRRFPLTNNGFGRTFRRARVRAGLEAGWEDPLTGQSKEITVRDLRRTHSTWRLAMGAEPHHLAVREGHDEATLGRHYADLRADIVDGRINREVLLDGHWPLPPGGLRAVAAA